MQLRGCTNTALACGDYPMAVLVEPGETRRVFLLRKERVLDAIRFEWHFVGESIEVEETEPPKVLHDAEE